MTEEVVDPEPNPDTAARSAERAAALGNRLRGIFDEVAAEPIPEAFEDLLRQLR